MRAFVGILLAGMALGLGCSDGGDDDDDSSGLGGGYGDACDGGLPVWSAALVDGNNYSFDGSMDIAEYPLAENTDITVEWDSLTQTMWGQPLEPTEVDTISLVAFLLSADEVEAGLNANTLEQGEVVALYLSLDVLGWSSVELSKLTMFGTEVDLWSYFDSSYAQTWLLTLSSGDTLGVGALMAAFLLPTPDETTTLVSITDDSTVVEVTADLGSLEPVAAPECAPLHLTWDDLTTDGQGGEIHNIDNRFLAYFPDVDPAAVQADPLSWKPSAAELWQAEVVMGELSASLDGDLSDAGTPFVGITADGTWLFGLESTSYFVPMPSFLTVIEVD